MVPISRISKPLLVERLTNATLSSIRTLKGPSQGTVMHNESQGKDTTEHRLHVFKDKAIGIGRSTWLIIGIVISFRNALVSFKTR